jgi:TRAP-type C4-dicarboxylate transport system permease small subunit
MSGNSENLQNLEKAGAWMEDAVLALILGSMIFLAVGQIIGRNLFNAVFFQGDEMLRLMVLWLTLAGAVAASRADKHISITILDRFLPDRIMTVAHVATNLFTSTVCALIAWHSFRFVRISYEYGDTLLGDMPAWALQLVLPIGFGLMAYRHAVHAIKRAIELIGGNKRSC